MRRAITLTIGAAVALSAAGSAATQQNAVDIEVADGVVLKGTCIPPGGTGPGRLRLHPCNLDRHAPVGLATDLMDAGSQC